MTGYAGLDGSRKIYQHKEYRRKLLMKYSECFFGVFETMRENGSVLPPSEADLSYEKLFLKKREEGLSCSGEDGGVLAALWRLLKEKRSGGYYSLRAIPVLQQTIEICELLELNPYRLDAPSARVWVTDEPGEILSAAAGAGVPFAVIGYTAGGVGIWRTDSEVPSSLRRPEKNELSALPGKAIS